MSTTHLIWLLNRYNKHLSKKYEVHFNNIHFLEWIRQVAFLTIEQNIFGKQVK